MGCKIAVETGLRPVSTTKLNKYNLLNLFYEKY